VKKQGGLTVMKRVKMFLLVLLSISMVITGCASTPEPKQPEAAAPEAPKETVEVKEEFELEWVAHPAYSLQGSDPKRVEYLTNVIAEFESANEHITIKPNVLSSNIGEAMAKLLEQASQGRAPDIVQIDSYILPRYYEYLQPLDTYLEKAGIDVNDFFPFAQNVMKGPDGKIYGIQFTTDTRVMYYRKDLVPNAPKTWDEVLETGKQLKDQGYDAFLFPGGRGEGSMVTSLWPFYWAQGGKLVDESGKPVFGEGENREKMLNVLNFLQESVKQGVTPQRVANYGSESDINAEVATGKVAMFLGGNWQVNQLRDIVGPDEFAKWAIAPLPQMSAGTEVTTAGGWAWGVFTDDPAKQEAAVNFLLQAFVGDKGMANWTTIGGYLPTRKSVYDLADYKGTEFSSSFREYLDEHAQMRPAAPIYQEISNQMQIAISSVISGSKSPEDALNEAWAVVNQ
jgi:multiple sugar transport system substrate-binding protein